MANIFVVYGSTEGQTRKIATFIAEAIQERGHVAEVADSTAVEPLMRDRTFDGFIVCASVHQGRHQTSVTHFVQEHWAALGRVPSAFVSVSLAAALDDSGSQDEVRQYAQTLIEETGWTPDLVAYVAGALRYSKYDFFKRFIMKLISRHRGIPTDTSQDYEFTDWDRVSQFVEDFLERLEASRIQAAEGASPEETS